MSEDVFIDMLEDDERTVDGGLSETTCSASSRIEAMMSERKFHLLANHPHLQAEAIADHYSSLAAVAMDMRKMVELRRRSGGSPEMDRCIERLTKEFVDHHREDFGIELSWSNTAYTTKS